MNLSILIITFNSEKYIEGCLESIYNSLSKIQNYEIIVFDNNSNDRTINILQDIKNNSTKLILNTFNKGYSTAINEAVKQSKFGNILILNPDVVINNNSIDLLLNALSLDRAGVVGPKVVNRDGSFQLSSRRHFPTLGILISYMFKFNIIFPKNKFFGRYNYTFTDPDLILDVDTTSGSCMMFKKEIYNYVNGFDEDFFMYFEDTDFCTKVKDKGYRIIYYPNAEVIHNNDYLDNYNSKMVHFFESFKIFLFKYKYRIYLGSLVYFFAKGIRRFSYLKRIIYFNYNYKINNE